MVQEVNFTDLDSILNFSVKDEDEDEKKYIKENLRDNDDSTQLERFPKNRKGLGNNSYLEENNFDDTSISDINYDYDKMYNVSNETIGKFNDELNQNYIKNECDNNILLKIFEIKPMNNSRFELSLGSKSSVGDFNEKKNFNTSNQNKINKKDFIGKKRKFNIDNPEKFAIFTKGGKDNQTRLFIEKNKHSNKSKNKNKDKKRKYDPDNIRKKVKTGFIKALKKNINENLKNAGSLKLFTSLPQNFIRSVSKEMNKEVQDITFKEVFSKSFCYEGYENELDPNIKKYKWNLSVFNYLEKRETICKKSNYYNYVNMKYYQIFNEYLRSQEFEKEIYNLKKKKKNPMNILHII